MVTLKEIKSLVEKDYCEIADQKEIWNLVKGGHSLGKLLKKYPHLGYSIEHISITHRDGSERMIGYINVGDSYTKTILRNLNGKLIIDTLGDYIERHGCWTVN